jgi:hypothetical protein
MIAQVVPGEESRSPCRGIGPFVPKPGKRVGPERFVVRSVRVVAEPSGRRIAVGRYEPVPVGVDAWIVVGDDELKPVEMMLLAERRSRLKRLRLCRPLGDRADETSRDAPLDIDGGDEYADLSAVTLHRDDDGIGVRGPRSEPQQEKQDARRRPASVSRTFVSFP